ncbi:ribonuclease R [Arcobacter sp. 15-2]|uniref:RNB domain-containing ribonuclease n=1 Tax=Arcobacter sp. 15-2 TaxID=3374109 RepID=UPI00399CA640
MKNETLKKIYDEQSTQIVKFENNVYSLNSKYKIGTVSISEKIATLHLSTNSSQKIYLDFDKLNGAYRDDIVLVQILFNPKGRTKAKVIQILNRTENDILCYVKNKNLYTIKENILIDCEIVNNKDGDVVVFSQGKITSKFGHIEDAKVDEKISLFLYHELYRLDETPLSNYSILKKDTRTDLTDLEFSTIDPASAKDHDDAIYFDEQSNEIYVAIADVSAYVEEDSSLDKAAFQRSFSLYFPHKVLPMLPFELSTDLCSLVPNKPRPAYVFKMKLNKNHTKVISSELLEAMIESKHKHSYEYIDEVLERNDDNNIHTKLFKITQKLKKNRLKNGFDFRNDEIRLILDQEENLIDFKLESSSPSHSLVEECMLLANQEAAKKLKSIGIFRVHDEPSDSKIKKLIDEVNFLGIEAKLKEDVHSTIISIQKLARKANLEQEVDELIIQSQQQASYSSIKKPHFGLGFTDYSHFTSPIRRYSDLVLHRILKTGKIPENIETICEDISIKEREIARLVWDYEDRKYARYLSKNIGKIYLATIVDTDTILVKLIEGVKGARVHIENYGGEKLFSQVKVKIASSDIISKKITGNIV